MARRALITVFAFVFAVLAGCASNPKSGDVVSSPNYDGIYRLSYSAAGNALYYRFYPDGVVLSIRTGALDSKAVPNLTPDSNDVSRGTWHAAPGEISVGVEEGSVSYVSRFDINAEGRIALRGLPRAFEFIHTDSAGGAVAAR